MLCTAICLIYVAQMTQGVVARIWTSKSAQFSFFWIRERFLDFRFWNYVGILKIIFDIKDNWLICIVSNSFPDHAELGCYTYNCVEKLYNMLLKLHIS